MEIATCCVIQCSGWFSPGRPKINLFVSAMLCCYFSVVEWRQNLFIVAVFEARRRAFSGVVFKVGRQSRSRKQT